MLTYYPLSHRYPELSFCSSLSHAKRILSSTPLSLSTRYVVAGLFATLHRTGPSRLNSPQPGGEEKLGYLRTIEE